MARERDERYKQLGVGMIILIVVTVVVVGLLGGWRYIPGVVGEWIGIVMGVATTPFILETTFFLLGLTIVLFLNSYRRHREGDEFVYLDQIEGPDVPADLPEQARWASYRTAPLAGEDPTLLDQAEGAMAIGDHAEAARFIQEMAPGDLENPATLRVRLELARAAGRHELVREIAARLAAAGESI